jgi:hypothetical protein
MSERRAKITAGHAPVALGSAQGKTELAKRRNPPGILQRRWTVGPARLGTFVLGALLLLAAYLPAAAAAMPSETPFEIIPGSFHVTPSTHQAGAHE